MECERSVENGEWMEWTLENGECKMLNGERRVVRAGQKVETGDWSDVSYILNSSKAGLYRG